MREEILEQLNKIEINYGVKILYAVESGSRAWNFASNDSDYDIRFIYAHPADWYLKVFPGRDVIELMEEDRLLDFGGWDIKKTLQLMFVSNPPLMEWLQSPIVYIKDEFVYNILSGLKSIFYSDNKAIRHYYHMAKNNFDKYIRNRNEVWVKKYLYVLRPVLAAKWIQTYRTTPPLEINILIDNLVLDPALKGDIEHLLADKRNGDELGVGAPIPNLSEYLSAELEYLSNYRLDNKQEMSDKEMHQLIDNAFSRILENNLWRPVNELD